MSKYLTDGQIQQFGDMVKQAYQGMGQARKTVRVKTGVIGNQYKFPTMGKGVATPRVPQTDVVPMNISHSRKTATITDWNAPEYTDIFDQQKTNVDEKRNLAYVIAGAITRREDQIILDALTAASTSLTVSNDIGGTDTNLNTAKFRETKKLLDAKGVPMGDRHMFIHANNLYGLLGDADATTFDKNTIRALVDGEISRWLGFQVMVFEDRDEGGLTLSSSDRTCFAFHGGQRGALGMANGIEFRSEVNYVPEKTSWLSNGLFAAGAVAIDAEGIVEITCRE